jgi:hypothetical protein
MHKGKLGKLNQFVTQLSEKVKNQFFEAYFEVIDALDENQRQLSRYREKE